jgi:hypothetical protein
MFAPISSLIYGPIDSKPSANERELCSRQTGRILRAFPISLNRESDELFKKKDATSKLSEQQLQ